MNNKSIKHLQEVVSSSISYDSLNYRLSANTKNVVMTTLTL
jgi:hypothetical protein